MKKQLLSFVLICSMLSSSKTPAFTGIISNAVPVIYHSSQLILAGYSSWMYFNYLKKITTDFTQGQIDKRYILEGLLMKVIILTAITTTAKCGLSGFGIIDSCSC